MGNEIRLTLIATGFITKEACAAAAWKKEMTGPLKSLKNKEELGVPSFLRRPVSSSRRPMPAPSTEKSPSNASQGDHD